jgi:hypothetical protein
MYFKIYLYFYTTYLLPSIKCNLKVRSQRGLKRLALAVSLRSAAVGVSDLLQEPASCYERLLRTAW